MTASQRLRDGMAVEFHGVAFSYADAEGNLFEPVLKGVNLSVARGQCVAVTGCSGCGKTTLMRLVNGLAPQAYDGELSGAVRVLGQDAADLGIEGLSLCVGSVFQNPRSQFFNLDTTSEIAFGCENAGLPHDEIHLRVHDAAADLGISHLLDRDIRKLSGGQRQMVALASVHALGPEVFALDEPTAALDVASMRTLAHLVRRLKELGRTVIVSEHRLWWLRGIADRVVHMENGRIAHDWVAAEFERLSVCELHQMGLRAWRIEDARAEDMPTARQDPSAPMLAPGAASAAALSFSDLRAGYRRGGDVLRGAAGVFAPRRIAALLGGNGAGKSTLARCLAGLHRERAGQVAFGGRSVPYRRRAGRAFLVMQEPGYQLFAHTTACELEAAAARRLGRGKAARMAASEALDRFGLAHLAERHPLSLSGGERQRLAIAAGVLQGARVLVLDEPTSGLDFANMQAVARELERVRDGGTCVTVITHDYEFIVAACDEVAVVADGRVSVQEPLERANLPAVRRMLGFDG